MGTVPASTNRRSVRRDIAAAIVLVMSGSGCFGSPGYRVPQLFPRSIDYERAETRVHDPFPATDVGPDISARPQGFSTPRPEPMRTKEKSGISNLRNQLGAPVGPVTPGIQNPSYFGVVR